MKSKNKEHKIGNIYQINPDLDEHLGGQFVVATDIFSWGIVGYLLLDRPETGKLVRFQGLAYIRPKYDKLVLVGFAEWMNPRLSLESKDGDEKAK